MYLKLVSILHACAFILVTADLVDLALEVVNDFRRHLVSKDLIQVDPLVSRDGLIGRQLNAFLDLKS